MTRVRRTLLLSLFILIGLAFLAAMHGYLALRLVLEPGWGEPWVALGLALLAIAGLLTLLQPFAEHAIGPPRSRLLTWPVSLWMGGGFLAVHLLLVSDLLLWIGRLAFHHAPGEAILSARAIGVVGVVILAVLYGMRRALRPPDVVRVRVEIPEWPAALSGFRIAQLSDVHIGPLLGRAFANSIVERTNALAPDLVAFTGDAADGDAERLRSEAAPFGELRARHGVFFVTGNHDHFSGASSWCERLRALGLRVLRNECVSIERDGEGFDLVGVDDHRGALIGGGGEDLDLALSARHPKRTTILLAHDPGTFRKARRKRVALQLSGHTHGGQIWPFGFYVRLSVPWVRGLYREGDAQLYVSSGTGFWGPPMRIGTRAEITLIEIVGAGTPVAPSGSPRGSL